MIRKCVQLGNTSYSDEMIQKDRYELSSMAAYVTLAKYHQNPIARILKQFALQCNYYSAIIICLLSRK